MKDGDTSCAAAVLSGKLKRVATGIPDYRMGSRLAALLGGIEEAAAKAPLRRVGRLKDARAHLGELDDVMVRLAREYRRTMSAAQRDASAARIKRAWESLEASGVMKRLTLEDLAERETISSLLAVLSNGQLSSPGEVELSMALPLVDEAIASNSIGELVQDASAMADPISVKVSVLLPIWCVVMALFLVHPTLWQLANNVYFAVSIWQSLSLVYDQAGNRPAD